MYGKRQTFPSPTATPIIVMMAPKREPNVSRCDGAPRPRSAAVTCSGASGRGARATPARMVDDVFPLAGVRARHHRDHRLRRAQIAHFVRDARFNEDEVARYVVHLVLEGRTVLVADHAFEDVQHHFEIHMNVCEGYPSG